MMVFVTVRGSIPVGRKEKVVILKTVYNRSLLRNKRERKVCDGG